jgi:hypothetical protein
VLFSRDGNYLYSGARRDPSLICWDVRAGGGPLYTLARDTGATNQRVAFDIDPTGRHLATGGADGAVRVRAYGSLGAGGLWGRTLRGRIDRLRAPLSPARRLPVSNPSPHPHGPTMAPIPLPGV